MERSQKFVRRNLQAQLKILKKIIETSNEIESKNVSRTRKKTFFLQFIEGKETEFEFKRNQPQYICLSSILVK
jgi:hypothetical protein